MDNNALSEPMTVYFTEAYLHRPGLMGCYSTQLHHVIYRYPPNHDPIPAHSVVLVSSGSDVLVARICDVALWH